MCKVTRTQRSRIKTLDDQKKKSVIQSDLRPSLNTENVEFTKPFVRSVFDPLSSLLKAEEKFAVNVSQLWTQIIANSDVSDILRKLWRLETTLNGEALAKYGRMPRHSWSENSEPSRLIGVNGEPTEFCYFKGLTHRMVGNFRSLAIVPSGVQFCQICIFYGHL